MLPSDIGPHASYLSFLALVVCLSSEQTGPGARSEPRNIKIKMRKKPRADKKEPLGKCQVSVESVSIF